MKKKQNLKLSNLQTDGQTEFNLFSGLERDSQISFHNEMEQKNGRNKK